MARHQSLYSAELYEPITPADANLAQATRQVMVGGAGDLVLKRLDGVVVTLPALAGQVFDVVATQVRAATTATGIVALY